MTSKRVLFLLIILLFIPWKIFSQDPLRFRPEIDTILKKYSGITGRGDLIVFTGSSTIRKWQDIKEYFPGKNIINTGFGGSQMSDLICFAEEAIIRYKPSQVFIYEGDNDLGSGENATAVYNEADSLARIIHKKLPAAEIVFISAKPSPKRWALKDEFIRLNKLLSQLPSKYKYVKYIDLWTPLIGPNGRPSGSYFVSDSLHMNSAGYKKWAPLVATYLR